MGVVVDFAWTKPTVDQLKQWGAVAVGMYLSHDPAKNATPQLVDEYAQAGIKTILFFEDAATRATQGYAAGKADASLAAAEAAKLGKPAWAPILPGVDFDIPDYAPHQASPAAKLGPVADYFKGWADTLGGVSEVGGYGGYWAISRLSACHLITAGVQTVAWSGGKADTRDIACLQTATQLDNGNVDVELIEQANMLARIAWIPGEPNPGAHTPPEHPADAPWVAKGQMSLKALAHGPLRSDTATVLYTTVKHTGMSADLAAYVNGGDLAVARLKAGTVLWYPKMVPA